MDHRNEAEESIWQDVKSVGRAIVPYVAIATLGASVFGVATMLKQKREEKPLIDDALERFKHLNVNIGEAACLQLVIRYACISPDWHAQYLEKADQLTKIYGLFHVLVDSCETTMNESHAAANGNTQVPITSQHQKTWRKEAYRSKYMAAVYLEDAINIRMSLVALSGQLNQLIRAWKTYWNAVGNIFLAQLHFRGDDTKDEHAKSMLNIKLKHVISLRKTGLDSILKIGESAPSNVRSDSRQSFQSYDLGSYNTIVTVHVGWWVRMHTTFLPQMSQVAQRLGWTPDGTDFEREAESTSLSLAGNVQNNGGSSSGAGGTAKKTKIVTAEPMASTKSSVIHQLKVWQSRLRRDGVVDVVTDPWKGFQPSEWEETFIPTCDIEPRAVQEALMNLQKKFDSHVQFMFECVDYIDEAFNRTILSTGMIGMSTISLMSPDELDSLFVDQAQLASESSKRIKILETIWHRMAT